MLCRNSIHLTKKKDIFATYIKITTKKHKFNVSYLALVAEN